MIIIPISEKELKYIAKKYKLYNFNDNDQLDIILEILEDEILNNIIKKYNYDFKIKEKYLLIYIM
jgi:hypothetical protein